MAQERLRDAFAFADRQNFVPEPYTAEAHRDAALPIGYGQTISQPYTVKKMLVWLDPQPNDRVLDVGSGSGWSTALLSRLVGPKGHVYTVERIPELLAFGRWNCERLGVSNASFFQASEDVLGLPDHAPYDRILVSAAAKNLPEQLMDQLKIGGKLVIPINSDIVEITRISKTRGRMKNHSGFVFVPLL